MSDMKQNAIQRWLNVAVRSLHLVFVILLGAALLQAPRDSHGPSIGVVISGAAARPAGQAALVSGSLRRVAHHQVHGRPVDGGL